MDRFLNIVLCSWVGLKIPHMVTKTKDFLANCYDNSFLRISNCELDEVCCPYLKIVLVQVAVDIESFWTEGYAGQIPNSGHELAIYVL